MANDQYRQFNCYLVLRISPAATPGDIKSAWRQASLRSHPDRGGSHAEQAKINVAYEILSDPVQRQAHDIYWKIGKPRPDSQRQARPNQDKRSGESQPSSGHSATQSFAEFQRRVDSAIQAKKAGIWAEFETIKRSRTDETIKRFETERTTFFGMAFGGAAAAALALVYPLLWPVAAFLAFVAGSKLKGVQVGEQKIPLFSSELSQKIERQAHDAAAKDCHFKAAAFEKYNSDLATMVQLITRPSSFDDSEIQVARRLTAAMFLSGYNPTNYDGDSRTILFADGDEKLLVRFRHRSGMTVNISYVEKLCELMTSHQASNGLLFCSPGLSGNAARLATSQRIKSYTLESMNNWIDEILKSDRVGPTGDVLASLDNLRTFIAGIAPRLNRWSRRGRRY